MFQKTTTTDDRILRDYCERHRRRFILWAIIKYGFSEEETGRFFEEAVDTFCQTLSAGMVTAAANTYETYLYVLGANKAWSRIRETVN